MRLTQAIDVINRKRLPSTDEFNVKFTHISKEEAREIRKKTKQNLIDKVGKC